MDHMLEPTDGLSRLMPSVTTPSGACSWPNS
jgi:hypothetical protein